MSRSAGARQQYAEGAALSQFARNVDTAAQALNDPMYYPKAETAAGRFGAEKRIQHPGLRFRRYSRPRVGDLQLHVITLGQTCRSLQDLTNCHNSGGQTNRS